MSIRRICLYAGAGAGKSTTAARIFADLKIKGYKTEYVSEFIKSWAYQGRFPKSFEQMYVFAQQTYLEDSLMPHVDSIVTDSPILLNVAYSKKYMEKR